MKKVPQGTRCVEDGAGTNNTGLPATNGWDFRESTRRQWIPVGGWIHRTTGIPYANTISASIARLRRPLRPTKEVPQGTRFYAEVKTKDKKDLSPSALTSISAAIHRTITSQPFARTINILKDAEFLQSNKMFEVVCKSYYKHVNPKPEHKSPIEPGDMDKLRSYFDVDSPNKLQEFVWFNDDSEQKYVCIKHTEQSKNYQGGYKQKDQDYSDVRMYGIPGSPLDPIAALEKMLEKLHPECDALLQTPLVNFDKKGSCWYKNEPLGKNSISKLMPKISQKAGLSKVYTAHCVRA
ncbi:predicted protein [Nematostella vectensis]|uniref:Uncharacterized protein n=1 Tax=Nematostella vectensis TaxID=45351 RepID=A7RMW2_NEMVE|nr:predicted protein [Nematostella vectensis]|eukprot:XP_001639277.1 predicted protein [Nematostella vectensis]